MLATLSLFVALFLSLSLGALTPVSSPTPSSCAVLDRSQPGDGYKAYDITATSYNVSDGRGIVQVNMCLDVERSCAKTSNRECSICQFITTEHTYCLALRDGETYIPLNTTRYPGITGFRATLTGDPHGCPANRNRITYIDVLCGQTATALTFLGENTTCVYNFQFATTGSCTLTPASFTPTFTVTAVTATSMSLVIDDGYPWQFWQYSVSLNNILAYYGGSRVITVDNLAPATIYSVVVSRIAGEDAIFNLNSPSAVVVATTLPRTVATGSTGSNSATNAPVSQTTPNVTVSSKGGDIAIGMVIAIAIIAGLFGLYKVGKPFLADKLGGGKKGFSLMDAERSTAFE